jgi:uncharacterized protein YkwD
VHSTKSGPCGAGGTDMRVDAYRDWISDAAGGDVVVATEPAVDDTPDSKNGRLEGQTCGTQACSTSLTCTEVFGSGYSKPIGKFCLERCQKLGKDASCDGEEFCTKSRQGALVCFNPKNPNGGFASNGASSDASDPTIPPGEDDPPDPSPDDGDPGDVSPGDEEPGDGDSEAPSDEDDNNVGNAEEEGVLRLLNEVRAENGMGPVEMDPIGVKAARLHSQDMCEKGYFDHTNMEGQQPWDRLRDAGADFGTAGENIAMGASSPEEVHDMWMNSSGHRENMLTPSWSRVGIGMFDCDGMIYWTEVFMD